MKPVSILGSIAGVGLAAVLLGTLPARAEPLVYVPLGGDDRIVVVDTATDEVVDTIAGLTAVHGLAGTPDGRFLIAGSYEERTEEGSLPVKPSGVSEDEHAAHHGAAPTRKGRTGASVSTVSVVSIADRTVVRRVDVAGAVHHVAVHPDGRFAAVTHPNEGNISVIDLGSYEVVAQIATGPLPNYAVFSPTGEELYVSNAGNDTISAVDVVSWTIRWNATVGSSPEHVVLSPDGATLYVNNVDSGSVSIVATAEGKVAKTITIGSRLHGIDLSDDGKTLFVAALGDNRVFAVDLVDGTDRSISLAPAPYHLAAIGGAGKLYVSSADEPKVWVLDQNTLAVLGEIPVGGKGHQMVQGAGS